MEQTGLNCSGGGIAFKIIRAKRRRRKTTKERRIENCGRRDRGSEEAGRGMIERRDGGKIAYWHAILDIFDLFLSFSPTSRRQTRHRCRNTNTVWHVDVGPHDKRGEWKLT